MARSYTYVGHDERYYPELGVLVHPGESVTLEGMPADGRWTTPTAKAARAARASHPHRDDPPVTEPPADPAAEPEKE